ncbi:MAG: hypothetical protein IPL53_10820 [Ignavibacteria bacterium]|nr:hypothetical protein [Ignavibacteria bacterium]
MNEIDKIEEISDVSSFFYGINTFSKSINIISKDIFQPKPFSQLRFSQDRFGSLFADFIFSQPFSRKANVQLGITNHSAEGRYDNSDYNIWRGRGRINFFLSPKFNAKLNFYLNNFNRGLNDGLIYSPVSADLEDDEAPVVNPSANEHLENYYYDLTMTGRFFKNKSSLTKLLLYSNNSTRHLNNSDSNLTFGNYPPGYTHSLLYGVDLSQNFFISHGRNFGSDILLGGNVYLNSFNGNLSTGYQNNQYSLRMKYDLSYKSLFLSALLRNDNISKNNYINAGVEAQFILINNKDFMAEINGGINQTNYRMFNNAYGVLFGSNGLLDLETTFYETGAQIEYKNLKLSGELYETNYEIINGNINLRGANTNLTLVTTNADISVSYNTSNGTPANYVKSDIAYKGILFRGKLKLKTGINMKYYNINNIVEQNQTAYSKYYSSSTFPQQNQFIADFYIGARIGKANVNLTIANILNSLVYNAYVFPLDNRGGLLNSISRFTIVWDFIN